MKRKFSGNQRGIALLLALLALLLVSAIAFGMIYSTDVETTINYNYRHSQLAFFSARAGLEEVRERLGTLDPHPITPPTAMPGPPGSVIYLRNPRLAGGSPETITPTDPQNPYFDTELCHDNFSGLALTNPGANIPCTGGAPTSAVTYVSSIAPFTNTAWALDYKWVRITLKANNSLAPYYVNGSSAAATANVQVCYDGANEAVLPSGFTDCGAAGMQPVYLLTSLAVTPSGGRRMMHYEVSSSLLKPSGVLNAEAANAAPAFNNGFPSGTGDRIPPTTIDGRAYDINGNLLAGGSCSAVPAIATDANQASAQLVGALDNLRQNVVTRANDFCNADGSSRNGGHPCTPGLWWVRGTDPAPRYSDTSNSCSASSPICYKNLNLNAPELEAISATFAPHIPNVTLPNPPSAPLIGAAGNVAADPTLTQTSQANMQQQVQIINDAVTAAQLSGQLTTISNSPLNGGTYTFGDATHPEVVLVTTPGGMELNNGATMTGYGILVVPNNFRIGNATLNWTGIVLVQPPSGELRLDTGATGFINGAVYLQANANGTVNIRTSDSVSNSFRISYSCQAIALAMAQLPLRPLSAVQLPY